MVSRHLLDLPCRETRAWRWKLASPSYDCLPLQIKARSTFSNQYIQAPRLLSSIYHYHNHILYRRTLFPARIDLPRYLCINRGLRRPCPWQTLSLQPHSTSILHNSNSSNHSISRFRSRSTARVLLLIKTYTLIRVIHHIRVKGARLCHRSPNVPSTLSLSNHFLTSNLLTSTRNSTLLQSFSIRRLALPCLQPSPLHRLYQDSNTHTLFPPRHHLRLRRLPPKPTWWHMRVMGWSTTTIRHSSHLRRRTRLRILPWRMQIRTDI